MHNIIIRTNFNEKIGLGHIFRMKNLAKELSKSSKLTFYLDEHNELTEKILDYDFEYLYKKNEKFKSQKEDSLKLKKRIKNKKIDCIIVDDYRFDENWEKTFYKIYPVIVFDDNNIKNHKCDIIIDSKWEGTNTAYRYKNLVDKNTLKLLGPQFSIVDTKKINKNKVHSFNILFYIGGGGNYKRYYNFLKKFSETLKRYKNCKILVVSGPLVSKKEQNQLIKFEKKFNNIKIIRNNFNISKLLLDINLYVGVASSIIYELNYHNILSVLFANAENQKNNVANLADLGFNFFIKKQDLFLRAQKVSELLILILKNYKRLNYSTKDKIYVDQNGSKKISKFIINLIDNNLVKLTKFKKINVKDEYLKKKIIYKKDGIYKIKDNELNNYLISRNLKTNLKNSINTKKITNLDHYIWWLTQKSKLFCLIRKNKIRIYLNHKRILINKKKYYYGGWFISKNKTNLSDFFTILNWQIKKFNKYPWLAIIKKKNHFVYKLNSYLKFKKISFNPMYREFFKIKNVNQYYLLKK
jgi:spore coat polysaccharide biosynthesis predicted glycosyltransferase SpsG